MGLFGGGSTPEADYTSKLRSSGSSSFDSDSFDSGSGGKLQFGAGEGAGLEENLAAAQQQMQVMQQLHKTTEMCWDMCVGTPSSSLSSREETCLTNCVGRFIDTTLLITNRFSQLAQKMQRWKLEDKCDMCVQFNTLVLHAVCNCALNTNCAIASADISFQFARLYFAKLYYIARISVIATQSPLFMPWHCTMGLSVALRIWNIWKCKGLDFAQFWSNIHQSSSNWSSTTQIFNEKYRHLIFVKNLGDLGKKREGGVCQGWNFWWWHMRSLWEKNLKIAFLTVAPFIVKFRFEKYRYLLTHLLCLQIFEVLLSDKHSTGPRNGRLVPLPVACLVWWYSFRPQIYDESETDQILNAKYFVGKNYTLGKWG